jgi:hypothetical protein
MRELTLNTTAWSTTTIADGYGEDFAITVDLLQRENPKLVLLRAPLDAGLLPDAP